MTPSNRRWPRGLFLGRLAPLAVAVLVVAAGGLLVAKAFSPVPSPAQLPSASLPSVGDADLYVSTDGDDSADGRRDHPLRTIQAAVDRATAGATVWIASGTYDGFTTHRSGSGAVITVAGQSGARPVIEPPSGRHVTIDLSGAHDLRLVNLAIHGPTGSEYDAVLLEHSSGIAIEGSSISGTRGGFGIEVRYSADVTISGNDIAHNAVGIRLYGEDDPTSVHDVTIEGNAIHDSDSMVVNDAIPNNDFGANGIIWHKVSGRTVARDNQIWNSRAASHDYGVDGGAFEIWGSSNMVIDGNAAWNNVNVMETGSDGPACAHITFTHNVAFVTTRGVGLILRCASDSLVAHNVLDHVGDYAFELSDRSGGNHFAQSIAGLRIVDNIVLQSRLYAIRNPLPSSVSLDYNLVWSPGGPIAEVYGRGSTDSLATFQRWTGYDPHSIQADPRVLDAAQHDYHLTPGSPALDAGVVVDGEAFTGRAPDIGRFEGAVSLASPSGGGATPTP